MQLAQTLTFFHDINPWDIRNPDILIIRGKSSEPWNIQQFDGIQFPVRHMVVSLENSSRQKGFLHDAYSWTILDVSQDSNAPMYLSMLLSFYSSFRFCFRQIQAYSSLKKIIAIHAYSEPCVSLAYSYNKAYSGSNISS